MKEIVVYSKPGCGQCIFTKMFLTKHNIDFTEKDVSADEEALVQIQQHDYNSLPVVSVNNFEVSWSGLNEKKLTELL